MLKRIFPAVHFINTNLPKERVQVLFPGKELSRLLDDSPNIFKRSNIDCYMERASAIFCDGEYKI